MDGKNDQANVSFEFHGKKVLKANPGDYTPPPPLAIIDCEKTSVEKKHTFKYKQAIILRKDIKMSPGKAIVQGAHVSVLAAVETKEKKPIVYTDWTAEGHAKIALRVETLGELKEMEKKAKDAGIITAIIVDFGLTELEPGTITALAIGPDLVENVNAVTKNLKLL